MSRILVINPILYTAETNRIPKVKSIRDTMIYTFCLGFLKLGHQVTLLEKTNRCGGQLLAAAVPPGKQEMAKGIHFLLEMNRKYHVDIRLNTEATKEAIDSFKPDTVIMAIGSTPIKCPVSCEDIPAVQAIDILRSREEPGEYNAVIGEIGRAHV